MPKLPDKIVVQFIDNPIDLETVFAIRREVFVDEQKVDPEEEFDEFEQNSRHFLAVFGKSPCGTARWRFTEKGIKLERFAVLRDFRNRKIGENLLKAVLNDVANFVDTKGKKIYLHAQLHAVPFYEKFGFIKEGEMFQEANIDHFKMHYELGIKN